MSAGAGSFLLGTLAWTGALIALVLILRRPVARHFGAQAAYALWALPLLRLALPPIVLPAWLRPAEVVPIVPMADAVTPMAAAPVSFAGPGSAEMAAPVSAPSLLPSVEEVVALLLLVWLVGAAVFLVRRFALYHALRRELLDGARPMGEAGRVRLVETPVISGPVAFGVIDKVVALPPGFMASSDRRGRDLALAHELAHHRGHDLLVNILVQPLFALHWFNPLGHAGWRALRRDQEAACDARVVAARPRQDRAAYAGVIAAFACRPGAVPRLALAAPMACPVLGDKSIVHRLRSLAMSDISPRRRFAGRALLACAALALPLTASISYAEARQDAPPPPEAPLSPEASLPPALDIETEPELRSADAAMAQADREVAEAEREAAEGERRVVVRRISKSGGPVRMERRVYHGDRLLTEDISGDRDHYMTAEERAELERDLAEMRRDLAESRREINREVRIAVAEAHAGSRAAAHVGPRVVNSCRNPDQPVTSETDDHGRTTLYVCESANNRIAVSALRHAREGIAHDPHMAKDVRAEVLRSVDAEIESLSE